jgi:outer membrane protein assembly factor BamD
MRSEQWARRPGYALLALIVAALAGCGPKVIEVAPADDIYAAATKDFEDEEYTAAVGRYRQFIDHYPLDPRTQEVEYRIAQSLYRDENYPEAIAAFTDFQRTYPTSPRLPEVEYTIAQAYMDQMDAVDRDLASSRNAHDRFRSVILRYPGTEYAEKASAKLQECREHLAERELYVATFYFDRGKLEAGELRVKGLIDHYPDTEAASEALRRLASAASSAGKDDLERLAEDAATELDTARAGKAEGASSRESVGAGPSLAALKQALANPTPTTPSEPTSES